MAAAFRSVPEHAGSSLLPPDIENHHSRPPRPPGTGLAMVRPLPPLLLCTVAYGTWIFKDLCQAQPQTGESCAGFLPPPPHPLSPQAILCRKPGSHLQYIQISFYFYFYFAELQFKSLKLPPERGALQWLLCVACCQTYSHRLGWETRSDVSGIAAAGNKEDGRVAGAVSAPPPAFHTSRSLNVSTGPEWFEILFYLNSLPVTGIF